MTDRDGQRWHDMGGQAAGPVDMGEHDHALWEKRVDALLVLCGKKGLFTVDGLRRALEDMGEDAFETMSYYERWIAAVNQNLVEAGVYTWRSWARGWRRSRRAAPPTARRSMAERVRVRAMMPPGHVRTPAYLRGKRGVIERELGAVAQPRAAGLRPARRDTPALPRALHHGRAVGRGRRGARRHPRCRDLRPLAGTGLSHAARP